MKAWEAKQGPVASSEPLPRCSTAIPNGAAGGQLPLLRPRMVEPPAECDASFKKLQTSACRLHGLNPEKPGGGAA